MIKHKIIPHSLLFVNIDIHNIKINHRQGMFPKMLDMKDTKQLETTRQGMLEYCKLDTLSMVKVLNKLWEVIK